MIHVSKVTSEAFDAWDEVSFFEETRAIVRTSTKKGKASGPVINADSIWLDHDPCCWVASGARLDFVVKSHLLLVGWYFVKSHHVVTPQQDEDPLFQAVRGGSLM